MTSLPHPFSSGCGRETNNLVCVALLHFHFMLDKHWNYDIAVIILWWNFATHKTYICQLMYTHMQVLFGWWIPKERYHVLILPVSLSCHNSHSTGVTMIIGSVNPFTRHQEATSYVCELILMAVVLAITHMYLCMHISWKVKMTINLNGLLNMTWRSGYSTGKEMRIMSTSLFNSSLG